MENYNVILTLLFPPIVLYKENKQVRLVKLSYYALRRRLNHYELLFLICKKGCNVTRNYSMCGVLNVYTRNLMKPVKRVSRSERNVVAHMYTVEDFLLRPVPVWNKFGLGMCRSNYIGNTIQAVYINNFIQSILLFQDKKSVGNGWSAIDDDLFVIWAVTVTLMIHHFPHDEQSQETHENTKCQFRLAKSFWVGTKGTSLIPIDDIWIPINWSL